MQCGEEGVGKRKSISTAYRATFGRLAQRGTGKRRRWTQVWVNTVTEGGRRFMAAWKKKEVADAARHRQEKKETTRLGELL